APVLHTAPAPAAATGHAPVLRSWGRPVCITGRPRCRTIRLPFRPIGPGFRLPAVTCPHCRRACRVRQASLDRAVVCTRCGGKFVAGDVAHPHGFAPDSYPAAGPKAWQVVVMALGLAALAAWGAHHTLGW